MVSAACRAVVDVLVVIVLLRTCCVIDMMYTLVSMSSLYRKIKQFTN
jgi:hypothetical protein